MNLTMIRRRESCPTCQQVIVPPTPSKVILVRVLMATFAVGSGLLEYRRALRRELEAAQLEQLHATSPDAPLDEHLAQRDPDAPFDVVRSVDLYSNGEHVASSGPISEPWPPAHPSLVDDGTREDATD